jgi:TRAP-type mannitol/chloroaromatic compound transport system permease large subunit
MPLFMWAVLFALIAQGQRPWVAAGASTIIFAIIRIKGGHQASFDAVSAMPQTLFSIVENDTAPAFWLLVLQSLVMWRTQAVHRLLDALNAFVGPGRSLVTAVAVVAIAGILLQERVADMLLLLLIPGVLLGLISVSCLLDALCKKTKRPHFVIATATLLWTFLGVQPFMPSAELVAYLLCLSSLGALMLRRTAPSVETNVQIQTNDRDILNGRIIFLMCIVVAAMAVVFFPSRWIAADMEYAILMFGASVSLMALIGLVHRWGPKKFLGPAAQAFADGSGMCAPLLLSFTVAYLGITTPSEAAVASLTGTLLWERLQRRLSWAAVRSGLIQTMGLFVLFLMLTLGFQPLLIERLEATSWWASLQQPLDPGASAP